MLKNLAFLIVLCICAFTIKAQWYYGNQEAVNLENTIGFNKHGQKIITGLATDPTTASVTGSAGTLLLRTTGELYLKKDNGNTINWEKVLDQNEIDTLLQGVTSDYISRIATATATERAKTTLDIATATSSLKTEISSDYISQIATATLTERAKTTLDIATATSSLKTEISSDYISRIATATSTERAQTNLDIATATGALTLRGLSDVDDSAVATGSVVSWNGTKNVYSVPSGGGKALNATSPIAITQDANSATFTLSDNVSINKTLSVAGSKITGQNLIDGSFESSTASFSVSNGSLTATETQKIQGMYSGAWTLTGTGTLDACANFNHISGNLVQSSGYIKSTSSDLQICSYVNGNETGCTPIGTIFNWKQVQSNATATASGNHCFRLKHTGSGSVTAFIDDVQIKPFEDHKTTIVETENVVYRGYSSKDALDRVKFVSKIKSDNGRIVADDNSGLYTKYTFLKPAYFTVTTSSYSVDTVNNNIQWHDSAGNLITEGRGEAGASGSGGAALTGRASVGDTLNVVFYPAPANSSAIHFSVTAQSITDSVVYSWEDGTEWTSYTPTTQGLGTLSGVDFKWKKQGSDVLIFGKFTVGTTTAVEGRIGLPSGLVSTSTIPTLQIAGYMIHSASADDRRVAVIEPSKTYMTLSKEGPSSAGLAKVTGDNFAISGTFSFTARIPIEGWSSTPTLLALPTSKENVFSARIDSSGNITSKNADWVNSVTLSDTSLYTIDITKLGLTSAPEVNVNAVGTWTSASALRIATVQSVNATSIVIRTSAQGSPTMNYEAHPFNIKIQKQGADYTPAGVFVGNVAKEQIAYLKDVKASGSGGGTSFSNNWGTRTLNTIEGDSSIVSLNSNQFTLQAGVYDIEASAPTCQVNNSQGAIYNVTDSTYDILGQADYAANTTSYPQALNRVMGRLSLTSQKTFEYRNFTEASVAAYGLGQNITTGQNNVFAQVKIRKLNGN